MSNEKKCEDCPLETIIEEIAKCSFACDGGPLDGHRGYRALVAKARELEADNKLQHEGLRQGTDRIAELGKTIMTMTDGMEAANKGLTVLNQTVIRLTEQNKNMAVILRANRLL